MCVTVRTKILWWPKILSIGYTVAVMDTLAVHKLPVRATTNSISRGWCLVGRVSKFKKKGGSCYV